MEHLDRLLELTYRAERTHFWFRGFPDNFQTLVNGLVHGEHYFFQSNQVVQVPMD